MKKDLIKRISIGLICGMFFLYLSYLFFSQQIIVGSWMGVNYFSDPLNYLYYIILAVVLFFLFFFFSLRPMYFKITKASTFVLGIALIIIGESVLVNSQQVWVGDLVKIFGVVLALLAWSNVLVTQQGKTSYQNTKVEIIEV